MLSFNHSQARMRVNNEKALFEVRSSIKVLRTPGSGIDRSIILPG